MIIRHLSIRNFRGIRELEWSPPEGVACLIGEGDSTKTTILTAIEYALSPRWSLPITDADFYGCYASTPVILEATVGGLARSMMAEDKFGFFLRGWTPGGEINDEPEPGDERVLTIRFKIDENLEPSWAVVSQRNPDGVPISSRDRAQLGVSRLDRDIDRDLSWSRYSALSRFTDHREEGSRALANAHRQAREILKTSKLESLNEAAKNAQGQAVALGVRVKGQFAALLEPALASLGLGTLSLHDGDTPLRAAGLGTRRLVSLALQAMGIVDGAIILIDEVELALEPHRLRHLLRVLVGDNAASAASNDISKAIAQAFLTTHSSIPVLALDPARLFIVRNHDGVSTLTPVPADLGWAVKRSPEALLARRLLVVEGATERGICTAIEATWVEGDRVPPAVAGTVVVDGRGGGVSATARSFRTLGYDVAVLADTDDVVQLDQDGLVRQDVALFPWEGSTALEDRIAADVPLVTLDAVVEKAVELATEGDDQEGRRRIVRAIEVHLGRSLPVGGVLSWIEAGEPESELRLAIGRAAKWGARKKGKPSDKEVGWFKGRSGGEALGSVVGPALALIPESPLARTLKAVGVWSTGGTSS